MKTSAASVLFALAAGIVAAPVDYTPPGGWDKVNYPAGTGANLPSYPAPPGGWENVKYPPGTGANAQSYPIPSMGGNLALPGNRIYTSFFTVLATPNEIITNDNVKVTGQAGALGIYQLGLNSKDNSICFNIIHLNVRGEYSSPARTATHIHQAVRGKAGPPRIAFPNPTGDGPLRQSSGCLSGPFVTGVNNTAGVDNGNAFNVAEIELAPQNFFADAHSREFVPGIFRGQLA